MNLYIQQGTTPSYRFSYFEHEGLRYFIDMTDVNQLLDKIAILPRLLHVQVRIYQCNENWQVDESSVLYYSSSYSFTDGYMIACADQFIANLQKTITKMQTYTFLEYIKSRIEAHQGKPDTKPIHDLLHDMSRDMANLETLQSGQLIISSISRHGFHVIPPMRAMIIAYKEYCRKNGYQYEAVSLRDI